MSLNEEQFKNTTVSPNQLAFQGLEKGAHPTAALARKGYSFKIEHDTEPDEGEPVDHYVLTAHHDALAGEAASLTWMGKDSDEGYYPGEIKFVHTMPAHQRQGLATALYRHASDTDMGQKTRPVHSPVLTPHGEKWSRAVGGPGADEYQESTAPEGYHPFEKDEEEPRAARRIKASFHDRRLASAGQKMLPGMENVR